MAEKRTHSARRSRKGKAVAAEIDAGAAEACAWFSFSENIPLEIATVEYFNLEVEWWMEFEKDFSRLYAVTPTPPPMSALPSRLIKQIRESVEQYERVLLDVH